MTTTYRARPTYRALSIRQPWAWAITDGGKTVENRDWLRCLYRGPLLIHASKGGTNREYADAVESIAAMRADLGLPPLPVPELELLPRGFLVGVMRIVGVDEPVAGALGLRLADARPLEPIPCKGALGLFEVPADLLLGTPYVEAWARLAEVRHA